MNVTFTAPAGSASVIGADGVLYPVVNGQVTMPENAVVAGMFAGGFAAIQVPIANGISISKTTSGEQTLLPAVAHARMIVGFFAEATEDYSANGGAYPTFSIGETGAPTRWDASNNAIKDILPGSSLGVNTSDYIGSNGALNAAGCILDADKAIIVTCTPAVGAGTGACKIVVVAVSAP